MSVLTGIGDLSGRGSKSFGVGKKDKVSKMTGEVASGAQEGGSVIREMLTGKKNKAIIGANEKAKSAAETAPEFTPDKGVVPERGAGKVVDQEG